jgi:hypothetical protein
MCTVSYLPTPAGFLLTHNRDEAPDRSGAGIHRLQTNQDTLIFPRDTRAGGTWIAAARSGKTACILNGAETKHLHEPPYRRSRGLLLLDFFESPDPDFFFQNYLLEGIEPFTFLFFQKNTAAEFRWDGQIRRLRRLPPDQPAFWCSATLYAPDMQAKRAAVFQQWLNTRTGPLSPAAALQLHREGRVGDPENDFVMQRSRVQTVSITQIARQNNRANMQYLELQSGQIARRRLSVPR